jgi:hypothetical protein
LFRNDAHWEGGVIEGPFVLRRDGWFYLFYSGNGCCGRGCNYALGVARSRKLLGPWEKYERNPVLDRNARWKCPGHGSIVQDPQGRDWLLYHAYAAEGAVASGRQGLLDEVRWENGWPVINGGAGPSTNAPAPAGAAQAPRHDAFHDDFSTPALQSGWHWPLDHAPLARQEDGRLWLAPAVGAGDLATVARSVPAEDSTAVTALYPRNVPTNTTAGLGIIGDPANAAGIEYGSGSLAVWRTDRGQRTELARTEISRTNLLHLRATITGGKEIRFAYSLDALGWTPLGEGIGSEQLPPWDRALRAALLVRTAAKSPAAFEHFSLYPTPSASR